MTFLKLETPIGFQCKKNHKYILHNFCFYDLKGKTNDFERNKLNFYFIFLFFWWPAPLTALFLHVFV